MRLKLPIASHFFYRKISCSISIEEKKKQQQNCMCDIKFEMRSSLYAMFSFIALISHYNQFKCKYICYCDNKHNIKTE